MGSPIEDERMTFAVGFSADGCTILACGNDSRIRLWDSRTGRLLGPPLEPSGWLATILTPDGRALVTVTDTSVQFWDISEIPDDPPRVQAWVESATGLAIVEQDEIRSLDAAAWGKRRRGAGAARRPAATEAASLPDDPIAPETVPADRARELIPWALPDKLALVLDNMIRSQPDDAELIYVRGLLHLSLGSPSRADDDFIEAFTLGHRDPRLIDRLIEDEGILRRAIGRVEENEEVSPQEEVAFAVLTLSARRAGRLARQHRWSAAAAEYENAVASSPDRPWLRRYQLLTLLAAGDRESFRRARAEMIQQFADVTDDSKDPEAIDPILVSEEIDLELVSDVAWFAAVAPGDAEHFDNLASLGRRAVDKLSDPDIQPRDPCTPAVQFKGALVVHRTTPVRGKRTVIGGRQSA